MSTVMDDTQLLEMINFYVKGCPYKEPTQVWALGKIWKYPEEFEKLKIELKQLERRLNGGYNE